jgi:hypothetical protein
MAYAFPRGETISLVAQVVAGDPTLVTAATAALRPALATAPSRVDPAQSAAATFTVTLQAAASDGSYPAFWLCLIAPSVSATVPIGNYLMDLRLTYADGSVFITPTLAIAITEPATVS